MTTKNTFNLLCIALLALVMLATPASAQLNTMFSTTLSNAVAATDQYVCLASNTNIAVQSVSSGGSQLYIDHEPMGVIGQTSFSTTCFSVIRPQFTTAHLSGAKVWFGPYNWFGATNPPGGVNSSCTLANIYAYPYIIPSTQQIWYCINSQWVNGDPQNGTVVPYTFFSTLNNPGNLIAPTTVTHVDGTEWYSQLYITSNATLTGACWLNGATVTTDNTIAILFDSAGNILANSALTGAADTGHASQYQCAAFLATATVIGPGTYYVGIQTKGTTDGFQAYATGGAPTNYATGSKTGTFGTLTNITPPTTFTTAKGPLMFTY